MGKPHGSSVMSSGRSSAHTPAPSHAIGSTIRLNDVPLTVVGVAPRNFDFPEKASVWTPTAYGKFATRAAGAQMASACPFTADTAIGPDSGG